MLSPQERKVQTDGISGANSVGTLETDKVKFYTGLPSFTILIYNFYSTSLTTVCCQNSSTLL